MPEHYLKKDIIGKFEKFNKGFTYGGNWRTSTLSYFWPLCVGSPAFPELLSFNSTITSAKYH